jgi:hypothetical protein
MALFYPSKQMALHIPGTGPAGNPDIGHLHVIINSPCPAKKSLLVPISTAHPRCDKTCLLTDGHKFIKHESFAFYAKADTVDAAVLIKCVNEKIIGYEGLFGEEQFNRICDGFLKSALVTPKIKKYYSEFCG